MNLLQNYRRQVAQLRSYGAASELNLKGPFASLLREYCKKDELLLVEELSIKNKNGKIIRPDGTLKGLNRLDRGYWESKGPEIDLEKAIHSKLHDDFYPDNNILFENVEQAVLFQEGKRILEVQMQANTDDLHNILDRFVSYEPLEYRLFREAMESFKSNLPEIIKALRELMERDAKTNPKFRETRDKFLAICQESINPDITPKDVREMIVQHILTADIFTTIFDDGSFHRSNNIARELENVLLTFFGRAQQKAFFKEIRGYYEAIKSTAAKIGDTKEKQTFLKLIYEEFYKAYNPKGADRLGIVYTPNEIVRFMIESTDSLLYKHFNKELLSPNVHILDPATGTGTFLTDLIDYFPASKPEQIKHKFLHELHANELSILPYYIANLNLEYAYQQKTGDYAEFPNLCFVDTLDNTGFGMKDTQQDMFSVSAENTARIKAQNKREISVIIGNPPYNANQKNYNDQNANREYKEVKKRIQATFTKQSKATNKANLYDMYVHFYRWAMDRVSQNGIVAFVTNNSFINMRAFDGFRKIVKDEFQRIYIVDLKGDVRQNNPAQGGNVFNIMAGVAVAFFVKDETLKDEPCKIFYHSSEDGISGDEKLDFLRHTAFKNIPFKLISPDKKHNWVSLSDNDFETLLPLGSKQVRAGQSEEAIFRLYSLGVNTKSDSWMYDLSIKNLTEKITFFTEMYEKTRKNLEHNEKFTIKWNRELSKHLNRNTSKVFEEDKIITSCYRPFSNRFLYFDKHFNAFTFQFPNFFGSKGEKENYGIIISNSANRKDFFCFAASRVIDINYNGDPVEFLPLYRYNAEGQRLENITDWGLKQFRTHYTNTPTTNSPKTNTPITKEDIFHYVYAVLHHPAYREKYKINLKRDFPRIPFYADFWQWANWGKTLMDLHLNYEEAEEFPLERIENSKPKEFPKVKLRRDKKQPDQILLDENTTLAGVPEAAWDYKLGNRSALEWVLDQYKEKKPRDETIREKFNTYRFSGYKEEVIVLLKKVCTVSLRTVEVVGEM